MRGNVNVLIFEIDSFDMCLWKKPSEEFREVEKEKGREGGETPEEQVTINSKRFFW